jgi:hypothetical protein
MTPFTPSNLTRGNRTPDREIIVAIAAAEARVVVTKDQDFVTQFHASRRASEIASGFHRQHFQRCLVSSWWPLNLGRFGGGAGPARFR